MSILNRKPKTQNPKPFFGVLLLLLLVAPWGCGPAAGPIIVFCSPDSPRMRQAIAGLQAALASEPLEVVSAPQFGHEAAAAWRRLRPRQPRLLVVLGTPALLQLAPLEKEVPVVFGLVANPFFTGVAYEPQHPQDHQENVTGIASPPPLTAALQQGASLLGPGPWGLLYDPGDGVAVELASRFSREAPGFGVKPLLQESSDAASDRAGLERLLALGARVLYLPPAASAARYAPFLLDWGARKKVRVVSSYPEGPHHGAILWVALDYRRLGEEVGALARRVLQGEKPARIPIVEKTPLQVEADEALIHHWSGYPPPKEKGKKGKGRKGEKGQN